MFITSHILTFPSNQQVHAESLDVVIMKLLEKYIKLWIIGKKFGLKKIKTRNILAVEK